MERAEKKQVIADFARDKKDTWSPEVQIAILTSRIEALNEHLLVHKIDNHSRRGIMLMVAKWRKLLNYLKKTRIEKYEEFLARLELRI
jgi:small subunit ribosomal protein S15